MLRTRGLRTVMDAFWVRVVLNMLQVVTWLQSPLRRMGARGWLPGAVCAWKNLHPVAVYDWKDRKNAFFVQS